MLHRNLKPRPPMTDPFGVAGQEWFARQVLPEDEQDALVPDRGFAPMAARFAVVLLFSAPPSVGSTARKRPRLVS